MAIGGPATDPAENPDYQALYSQLVNGETAPEAFLPAQLFEMATALAVTGNFEGKRRIYEEYILNHPQATPDDKTRVLTYRGDIKRRKGDPQGALAELLALPPPADPLAYCELLQAISECYLVIDDLPNATTTKQKILDVSKDPANNIPPDKAFFYLGGLIAAKIKAGQAAQAEEDLAAYKALLDSGELPENVRKYSLGSYHDMMGEVCEMQGKTNEAMANYKAKFDCIEGDGFKAVSALRYLHCALRANPSDRSAETLNMAEFFKTHEKDMQPTWIQALQAKYDFVKNMLPSINSPA